ncbi:MAG: hypothetical protein RLP44_20510 [Aggregatilineales bacterium]
MTYRLMLVLLLMLMPPVMPSTLAQDDDALTDEDLELIAYVSDSFTNLLQMSSVTIEGSLNFLTEFQSDEQSILQSVDSELMYNLLLEDARILALQMTSVQEAESRVEPGLDTTLNLSMELRFVDGVSYLRIYDLPLLLAIFLSDDWINLNEDDGYPPELEVFSSEQLDFLASIGGLGNYYTERTVTSIEERPEETLEDGTTTRVFSVEVDPTQAFSGLEETLRITLGLSEYSVGPVRFKYVILPTMTFNAVIWVDSATDLVAQVQVEWEIDSELESVDAPPADFHFVLSAILAYTDFNEEVEIIAPDLGE